MNSDLLLAYHLNFALVMPPNNACGCSRNGGSRLGGESRLKTIGVKLRNSAGFCS